MPLALTTCATSPGDTLDCPTCDNVTELLVGAARGVAIAEVEACGPDGHGHGEACHCFSGQQPTAIGGTEYCLQQGCGGSGAQMGDPDALACDEVSRTPELVTAVTWPCRAGPERSFSFSAPRSGPRRRYGQPSR